MKTIPNLHQVFGGANGGGVWRLAFGVRRLVAPGDRGASGVVREPEKGTARLVAPCLACPYSPQTPDNLYPTNRAAAPLMTARWRISLAMSMPRSNRGGLDSD
jgi:hypothetical protein